MEFTKRFSRNSTTVVLDPLLDDKASLILVFDLLAEMPSRFAVTVGYLSLWEASVNFTLFVAVFLLLVDLESIVMFLLLG